MQQRNTIRLSGSEIFVKKVGDTADGGVRESGNPKYEGNFIRYIRVNQIN